MAQMGCGCMPGPAGELFCECGEPVCEEHDVVHDGEFECAGCAKARERLESEGDEVTELAGLAGADEFQQMVERIRYVKKVEQEGFEDED